MEQPISAKRSPVLAIIAGAVLALSLFTPYLLVSIPVMVAVGLAIASAFRREEPRFLPYVVGGLAVVFLVVAHGHLNFGGIGQSTPVSAATLYKDATWQYGSAKDEMRGTISKWAVLYSPTDLTLSAPYEGDNSAHLQLTGSGSIILSVAKGQLLCPYASKRVSVKFDDGPVWSYPCESPSNGDSTTIYIESQYSPDKGQPQDIVDGIAKSKRMTIEAEFYDNGVRQLSFNVAGLDRSKL
jgi:hypothetical protein